MIYNLVIHGIVMFHIIPSEKCLSYGCLLFFTLQRIMFFTLINVDYYGNCVPLQSLGTDGYCNALFTYFSTLDV